MKEPGNKEPGGVGTNGEPVLGSADADGRTRVAPALATAGGPQPLGVIRFLSEQ